MSVLNVRELIAPDAGTVDVLELKFGIHRTYRRVFMVTCSSFADDASQVTVASDPVTGLTIPTPFAPYTPSYALPATGWDVGALCVRIDPHRLEGVLWEVVCDYDSHYPNPDSAQNPLLRPAVVKYATQKYQRAVPKDITGRPYLNSAGDPIDPPIEIDDCRLILTVDKNLPSYDLSLATVYKNTVNDKAWMGGTPMTWKCEAIDGELAFEDAILYWKVHYEFAYRSDTWLRTVLDRGYRKLVNGIRVRISDVDGSPLHEPALLDGNGNELQPGTGVAAITVLVPGTGYTGGGISITGGGGSGATAHAIISGGAITSVVVDAPGTGYTSAPTVTATGGGTSASLQASVGSLPVYLTFQDYTATDFSALNLP